MSVDLIFYAVVAAVLVIWLRNILGTQSGEERERPNPYLASVNASADDLNDDKNDAALEQDAREAEILDLAKNPTDLLSIENDDAKDGLLEIVKADKGFEVGAFLNGAQDAFAIIVESFAAGERDTLKNLLNDTVYGAFEGAISAREEQGHTQENEIRAIRKAEVIEARMQGKEAQITMRFVADQMSLTKDKEGAIIDGDADKTSVMRDIWVFGRNVRSKDPRWLVVETRGDFDGDNEMLPNTDE